MTTLTEGSLVNNFSAPATSNTTFTLADHVDKTNVILYFYPKDNTPGCTTEGQNFRDRYAEFQQLDTAIYGISRDTLRKHENFKKKQDFPFELISDEDETICKLFNVIKQKQLYGKMYMGIERSTFLINKQGILHREWRNIKIKGHIADVFETVKLMG
jgi:peroxiredoxin Q/BCP